MLTVTGNTSASYCKTNEVRAVSFYFINVNTYRVYYLEMLVQKEKEKLIVCKLYCQY